jgi:hypothetical protein
MRAKHKNKQMDNKKSQKSHFICLCSKQYKFQSGLSKHRSKCIVFKQIRDNNEQSNNQEKDEFRNIIFKLLDENKELQKQLTDIIPMINTTNHISNTNHFNINIFLNEKCKDAITIEKFIENIEISMPHLLTTINKGHTQGITNIIMDNINKLSIYERPLHCTDKKNKTLYIKHNKWEKDDNKEQINYVIDKIEKKQLQKVGTWIHANNDYMESESKKYEFVKLIKECNNSLKNKKHHRERNKIIKNMCNQIYV